MEPAADDLSVPEEHILLAHMLNSALIHSVLISSEGRRTFESDSFCFLSLHVLLTEAEQSAVWQLEL